jgi:RimJ/RimL family protein N-acetyltransferase
VTLRPLSVEADAAALFEVSHGGAAQESIWDYLWYGPFPDLAVMTAWLGSMVGKDDPLFFTVHQGAGHHPVGMVSILNIAPDMGRAELGHIWYAPQVQRTKVNTEAVFLLLQHLFDDLGYRRVEWKCDSRNEPSRKAALRLGFSYEGHFRQHMIIKGANRDTHWFSILDHEWPRLRANFQRWLYEDDSVSLGVLNAVPAA